MPRLPRPVGPAPPSSPLLSPLNRLPFAINRTPREPAAPPASTSAVSRRPASAQICSEGAEEWLRSAPGAHVTAAKGARVARSVLPAGSHLPGLRPTGAPRVGREALARFAQFCKSAYARSPTVADRAVLRSPRFAQFCDSSPACRLPWFLRLPPSARDPGCTSSSPSRRPIGRGPTSLLPRQPPRRVRLKSLDIARLDIARLVSQWAAGGQFASRGYSSGRSRLYRAPVGACVVSHRFLSPVFTQKVFCAQGFFRGRFFRGAFFLRRRVFFGLFSVLGFFACVAPFCFAHFVFGIPGKSEKKQRT